ncbi:hypothetical protein [Flavobacterium stagni]|uniref:Outermembrane protein n=1 Tax=Flavobacterium stagni TaxID=2506421 RepID=A0A4Q1KA05_9FLAO|nr:hypothetical protein [Flavobacterium stagni]RXR23436.1 hypothetical protein EQG61_05565 [Flavobacterium stagni]
MKFLVRGIITSYIALSSFTSIAQNQDQVQPERYTKHNKGKFYIFWGGNRESYSKSDIHFEGANYNFTVHDATAHDKPKGWHCDYINPGNMTIPQTNFRMGYFISDHYNISVGLDHMKYVMTQDQTAIVNGYINLPANEVGSMYNGIYQNAPVNFGTNFTGFDDTTPPPFLTFEHTDGLNYVNTEFCRVDDLSELFHLPNTDKFQINITEGIGLGVLYPKTNARVLGKPRHDDFHIAGYGVSAKVGLNFTFFKHFFIQTELKGGYIDMQDIRTTHSSTDKASQHFFFLQRIIALGGIFRI